MQESLFIQFIMALFPKLSLYVTTKVNNGKPMTYLHKTMLEPVYSADQKWEGTSANTVYVAADMVAMDSPLPVKKRDSIATSNGKLPKIGMEKKKGETDINTLNIMNAQYQSLVAGGNAQAAASQRQRIIQRFANDAVYCSVGIDEKNEANFLTALSDGVMAVPDDENTGTALRVSSAMTSSQATISVSRRRVISAVRTSSACWPRLTLMVSLSPPSSLPSRPIVK